MSQRRSILQLHSSVAPKDSLQVRLCHRHFVHRVPARQPSRRRLVPAVGASVGAQVRMGTHERRDHRRLRHVDIHVVHLLRMGEGEERFRGRRAIHGSTGAAGHAQRTRIL